MPAGSSGDPPDLANPQATNRLAQLGAERLARKGQVVQDAVGGGDVEGGG